MTLDDAIAKACGRTIQHASLFDDKLTLEFCDGSRLVMRDDASYCCERRFMRTDDELADFEGAIFTGAEVRPGPTTDLSLDDQTDCAFLHVHTSEGSFVCANYNEHNGYYGGFELEATLQGVYKETPDMSTLIPWEGN